MDLRDGKGALDRRIEQKFDFVLEFCCVSNKIRYSMRLSQSFVYFCQRTNPGLWASSVVCVATFDACIAGVQSSC